ETGQVLASDFREGNVPPCANNLEFIHLCESALPEGVELAAVRIDAAGYQVAIIDECIERKLKFAIRAQMSRSLKQLIQNQKETQWQPLQDPQRHPVPGEFTTHIVHAMEKSHYAFDVIVQRRLIEGQTLLDFDDESEQEVIQSGQYLYRAIAVS